MLLNALCQKGIGKMSYKEIKAKTSINQLRDLINLPPYSISCSWYEVILGENKSRLIPGPTDRELYAYVELDSGFFIPTLKIHSHLFQDIENVYLRKGIAQQLAPKSVIVKVVDSIDGFERIEGDIFDISAFSKAPYITSLGIRLGNGILFRAWTS
jgi:hypothetical protein